jgi:hypothetical protein
MFGAKRDGFEECRGSIAMSWDMRLSETTGDDGRIEWQVYLVSPDGKQEDYAGGGYFVGNDPDGDECRQACLEARAEADRRNGLTDADSSLEGK